MLSLQKSLSAAVVALMSVFEPLITITTDVKVAPDVAALADLIPQGVGQVRAQFLPIEE